VFIDGDYRDTITMAAFSVAPVIVCHDSQYEWTFKIQVPLEFKRLDFTSYPVTYENHEVDVRDNRPWTTIFTSNSAVIEHFNGLESKLYERYTFPYGLDLTLP
jgi:hypothetical protein